MSSGYKIEDLSNNQIEAAKILCDYILYSFPGLSIEDIFNTVMKVMKVMNRNNRINKSVVKIKIVGLEKYDNMYSGLNFYPNFKYHYFEDYRIRI